MSVYLCWLTLHWRGGGEIRPLGHHPINVIWIEARQIDRAIRTMRHHPYAVEWAKPRHVDRTIGTMYNHAGTVVLVMARRPDYKPE